ncbi:MAG TPA: hypothetical protein VN648_32900, partial [Candidatus Methylomirabilis sp.]|nr:hypothetical protein [Candidatus Methylomirabilis sp.]
MVSIVDREFEFAFFGPENDGLPFHAADHVEGGFGFTAQSQFQQVVFDAGFDGLAQLAGDLEEAVGGTKTFDALMRPLVIVVLEPEADAFPRRFEAFELGAGEELLPDAFPEPLDLAQRHGMMGARLEVVGAVLFHFRFEAGGATPVDVLPAIVREHLLGRLVFAGRHPKDLQHVLRGVTAEEVRPHDEPRVVVQEADQVGIASPQPEGEDVGLPHLVGRRPLKESWPHEVTPRPGRRLNQALRLEGLTDGLRTGLEEEHP